MRELRSAVGMPIGLPAFSWIVRIASRFLLRTDPELALYGRYVISKRLEEEGFEFQLPRDRLLDIRAGGLASCPGATGTRDKSLCQYPVVEGLARPAPKCMTMIRPDEVLQILERYS